MIRLSFVLLSFVLAFFSIEAMGDQASHIYPDCKVAEVLSVYDGVNFACKAGGNDVLGGMRLKVRVRGIENTVDKIAAARFVTHLLAAAKRVDIENVYMRNYFRVVADVNVDGKSLADILVREKMAKWQGVDKPAARQALAVDSKVVKADPPAADKSYKERRRQGHGGVDMTAFDADMPFEQALDIIRTSVLPELPIVVMWKEIEKNAFVSRDTPIGFSGTGRMTPGGALRVLLSSMNQIGTGLHYAVNDGVITIASTGTELKKRYLRVYDTSALVSDIYGMGTRNGGRYGNSGRRGQNGYGSSYGNNGYGFGSLSYGSGTNSFNGNNRFGNRSSNSSIWRPSSRGW